MPDVTPIGVPILQPRQCPQGTMMLRLGHDRGESKRTPEYLSDAIGHGPQMGHFAVPLDPDLHSAGTTSQYTCSPLPLP